MKKILVTTAYFCLIITVSSCAQMPRSLSEQLGGLNDGDGALSGDRDATIDASGASNEVTFSSAFVGGDPSSNGSGEHIVLRIQASHQWTGYITDIAITW